MNKLTVHRYQFNCQTKTELKLNNYSGSMLRGAFGHALRQLSCVTQMNSCKDCLLYRQCTYPKIFEMPVPQSSAFQTFSAIPNPYIIEPPPMGERALHKGEWFSFSVILIGGANQQLNLIIQAFKKALANGLGRARRPVMLQNIVFEPQQAVESIIYDAQQDKLLPLPTFQPPVFKQTEQVTLQLITPLRIQRKGQVLSTTLSARDFLMALVRRYYLLHEFYTDNYQAPDFSKLAQLAREVHCDATLQWHDWSRYSSRQKQKMTLGGVMGQLVLSGDLQPFWEIINAGQWLHAGNKTTFGMGHYQICV